MLLSDLVGMLFAAGGPPAARLRSPWTLHQALHALAKQAEEQQMAETLPAIEMSADAHVGAAVAGLVPALHELMRDGAIYVAGDGLEAVLVPDRVHLRRYRRQLMGLQPAVAQLIYRAATAWAALSLTEEKNWARAMESLARRRRSETPKRRHGALAVVL